MKQPVKEAIAVGKNQKSPDDDDRLSRRRHLRLCRCQHVCRRQSICLGRDFNPRLDSQKQLKVLNVLNVLKFLNVLTLLNLLKDPSLACWALFHRFSIVNSAIAIFCIAYCLCQ